MKILIDKVENGFLLQFPNGYTDSKVYVFEHADSLLTELAKMLGAFKEPVEGEEVEQTRQ